MAYLQYPVLCPKCGHELFRSHRRGLLENLVFRLLLIKAFRCHRCGARFCSPPAVVFRTRDFKKEEMSTAAEDSAASTDE